MAVDGRGSINTRLFLQTGRMKQISTSRKDRQAGGKAHEKNGDDAARNLQRSVPLTFYVTMQADAVEAAGGRRSIGRSAEDNHDSRG